MAKTFTVQLERFRDLTRANMEYVMRQSISDVLVGAQTTQIGITQGAESFVEGKIPVGLTAELVNSLTVDGATGPDVYVTAIAGMEIGEVMRFGWTAPHAMRMEMGFVGEDSLGRTYNQAGRYFVSRNAEQFSEHVEKRVAEVRK
jgi:hypothetical protein